MTDTPENGNGNGNGNGDGDGAPQSAAARLFDLRTMIGGLFVLYGIMLTVDGFFTSPANLAKASHININLWMGLGMLVLGVLFLLWWRLRPLRREQPDQPDQPDQPAPAETGADW